MRQQPNETALLAKGEVSFTGCHAVAQQRENATCLSSFLQVP